MKLLTSTIAKQAQKQYPRGSDMSQKVVAKFFDPYGLWQWFVMNQDPEDPDYFWGIVKGHEVEVGSFSLSELESLQIGGRPRIERDLHFTPRIASQIYAELLAGKHI